MAKALPVQEVKAIVNAHDDANATILKLKKNQNKKDNQAFRDVVNGKKK